MKFLSDYIEEKQTSLFNKTNAFFAFSKEQLEQGKKEGIVYLSCGQGLFVEKDKYKILMQGLEKIRKEGIEADLQENGKEAVIERELGNYECYYTLEIDDAADALEEYGITPDEILAQFNKNKFNKNNKN